MPQRDAYSGFLLSSDLPTWEKCLSAYDDLEEGQFAALSEALCISVYTLWLSRQQSEDDTYQRVVTIHRRLVAATRSCRQQLEQTEARIALAIAAASGGYSSTAAKILENDETTLEVAVLVMPQAPARRAALLQPKLIAAGSSPFLPAIYFCAHAFLDLGYLNDVDKLLDQVDSHASNPLVIDIKGKMHELRGAWEKARDTYSASERWPVHRYRKSICDVILSHESRPQHIAADASGIDTKSQQLDEDIREGMRDFSGEIDQAEVARSSSFVNACRWHDFDNWLVSYELGKLSFRRRRYSEADGFLRTASEYAPQAFQFNINYLRFINFTWLTGHSMLRHVPATPEMLECGYSTIEAEGSEKLKTQIRTYIAHQTKNNSILRPIFDTDDYYETAEAYSILGDTPKALEFWGRTIAEAYTPRALSSLAQFFFRSQFRHTANYLVGLITLESWDNFVDLWELAKSLNGLQDHTGAGLMDDALAEHFANISDRLLELCHSDFQHLIRAIEFFLSCNREDIASSLLQRADKLAESAEEQLQLARARRTISHGELDMLGVENLVRAEREANDRLVQLQIAREFSAYGHIQQARELLREEGVLGQNILLEQLEYAVALQCGQPCLTADEIIELSNAAKKGLGEALRTRQIENYGSFFIDRLGQFASPDDFDLATAEELDDAAGADEDSIWLTLKSDLEETITDPDLHLEKQLIAHNIGKLEQAQLFLKYSLWEYVFDDFERNVEAVKRIRPDVGEAETPVAKSIAVVSGLRARELTTLWKSYFSAGSVNEQDAIRESICQFHEQEQVLAEQWQQREQETMAEPLQRLKSLGENARAILAAIHRDELTGSAWPGHLDLREHLAHDVEALNEQLDQNTRFKDAYSQQAG